MQNVTAAGLGIGDDYPPRIMGVLNVSEESPYDPSVYDDPGEAARYVDSELIDEGADIVDVGLESANKRFEVLSAEQELDRLDTAVEAIESVSGDAVFSIETRYAVVADEALSRGFDMVNDICGFADPRMPDVCRERDAAAVKMASPPDLERPGAIEKPDDIYDALKREGLTEKTIVDPAFGGWSEAKTLHDDRETFRRLREFRGLGQPILVSINRKNFLRDLAGRSTEEALPVSLAATSMAVERGAHVIRTHDVAETLDAAKIGDAFARDRLRDGDLGVEELDVTNAGEAARHLDRIGADPEAAAETATRVFELSALSDAERETLAATAVDAGVTVAPGTAGVLLAGTPAAFGRLRSRVADESEADGASDRLVEALDAVNDAEQ
ncbi:dihydropteroate synthase [Halorussus gelatinilyticus]|uniref:Dihydropteroate synthase n=1 Tax=Halorussus gelatinilyticus TaxID=2937524 RepID=A0A8U0IIX5_9EURY|nr:dihydropteroate synthase [Halorussus gelatinilyticus]UPW00029.1 dihydropteroate synthase [Halorussus gelatinilyticus]